MLAEQFIASIGVATKAPVSSAVKDAAIFVHEHQPHTAQRAVFKKSATLRDCLAVSDSHIFAAQAEKAVVHVYSREKGNQEATVPFTERVTCLALACNDAVLILGTAEGKLFLWEIATGRQVTTAQSHFQAVTALAVDPTSNFLLSASHDSTVHVWSIPSLLSFTNTGIDPLTPIRTFSSHRTKIDALTVGHASWIYNFAVSASEDGTCHVWDFHTMTILRTYLLPDSPTCLVLDAADRAVYVGYEDGSIQHLDLYATLKSLRTGAEVSAPVQPSQSSRWINADKTAGSAMCLSISFDGTSVLSGHESGAILAWDMANRTAPKALLQMPLPGPVTNLSFLPDIGLSDALNPDIEVPAVLKPKFGAFDNIDGSVPVNYALHVQLWEHSSDHSPSGFKDALTAPTFPNTMLDDGLSQLQSWGKAPPTGAASEGAMVGTEEDFMALDDKPTQPQRMSIQQQNETLKSELEALRRLQRASFDKLEKVNAEKKALWLRDKKKMAGSDSEGLTNGKHIGGQDAMYSSSSDDG